VPPILHNFSEQIFTPSFNKKEVINDSGKEINFPLTLALSPSARRSLFNAAL
jgi:hypothetical protein